MHRVYKSYMFFLIFSCQVLWASGFTSLQTGPDARGAAMGFTGVASSPGATALYWNPALLARSHSTEAALSINRWIQGVQTGSFEFARSGFGLSLHYSQVGDIEHRIVPTEQPLGTFASTDAVMGVAYARPISSSLSLGVKLNGYYEKIYLDEAMGIGCDLGLFWSPPIQNLRIGAAIQHIGQTGNLRDSAIDLPRTIRAGADYLIRGPGGMWNAAVDLVQIMDEHLHVHAGLEWIGSGLIALRAGYQSGYETRGLTAGVGFQFNGIRLSYGYIPFQSGLGDAHIFTAVFSRKE